MEGEGRAKRKENAVYGARFAGSKMKKEFEEKCREKEERSEERMWRMERDLREIKKED